MQTGKKIRWRWGVMAALAMTLLSLFPQCYLWWERGRQWNGGQTFSYTDETAYAAYVNALIAGRPRRNDPYTGRDDNDGHRLAESLFSIQFIPPYFVALSARALGLSTATAFILLTPIAAFATALALFWLLVLITNDDRAAAAAVPLVLCLGLLVAGNGVVRPLFNQKATFVYLPFLRRYVPAVVFPCFLVFFGLVWQALSTSSRRRRLLYVLGAAAAFSVCLYGYFYLWTAALAWLALLTCLWLVARPDGWRESFRSIALLGTTIFAVLVPYLILLSRRAPTMDAVQALVRSHAADIWRSTEAIALVIVSVLVVSVIRQRVPRRDPRILFTFAFALLPFVLFNQQIITGRSLQPMHYAQFVVTYTTLIALALAMVLLRSGRVGNRPLHGLLLLAISLLGYGWGMGETLIAARRFAYANSSRDEALPVSLRLRELAKPPRRDQENPVDVVFVPSAGRSNNLPTIAPQAVLWAPHMFIFSGVSLAENKERFFQFLYYSGVPAQDFARYYETQEFMAYAVFGWERANQTLTVNFRPITAEEIANEGKSYSDYVANFDLVHAARPTLAYLLFDPDRPIDLSNLDRWYQRDQGERVGRFVIYRLTLRQN